MIITRAAAASTHAVSPVLIALASYVPDDAPAKKGAVCRQGFLDWSCCLDYCHLFSPTFYLFRLSASSLPADEKRGISDKTLW
jgi:hypothetical protein